MRPYLKIFIFGIIIEFIFYDILPQPITELVHQAWVNTYFIIWFYMIMKALHDIKHNDDSKTNQ